jgi:hypothetical protein
MLWTHTSPVACLGQVDLSLFLWSTARWGPWGTWQHRSSPLGEVRSEPRDSAGAHLDKEARSGAEEHVAAPKISYRRGRGRSHRTRGSTGVHLDREARPELRNTWQRQSSTQQGGEARDHVIHDSTRAHLNKEVRSRVMGHVAAPNLTSVGRCDLKLQFI